MAEKLQRTETLLAKYLVVAQSYYRTQVVSDSFQIADRDPLVYAARHPHSYYDDHFSKLQPDVAHLVVRELFAWLGDDRYSSRSLYLQIYARPSAYPIKENYYGGGRTFNGPPNTGGGVIQLELSWLMTEQNFPFLSTLIHELGHGFGLTHADCHGYDMDTNGSMMSSNTHLWSKGFSLSVPPPVFNPEEYLMLAQEQACVSQIQIWVAARHDRSGMTLGDHGQLSLGLDGRVDSGIPAACPAWVVSSSSDGRAVNGPESASECDK